MVTLRIPAPPAGLWSNLVGLLGLATIAVAVALLTDWRWGMLTGGLFAVVLAVLAQYGAAQQERRVAVTPIRPASATTKALA